jgi:serine/tyrosine/threonine adenylyltransferase
MASQSFITAVRPGFDHSYAALGNLFCSVQRLDPVSEPVLLLWNEDLAARLGWPGDPRSDPLQLQAVAGNQALECSQPVATVYAGHQFGQYNPQLGDGRATLLGEWVTEAGERFDIQLKGAGPTPYSRGGDGRSPMGPVIREYLVSEAMHALGVPTTRALAAVASGEPVMRTRMEPGAILTRVASSHLRIGTVQYFAMTRGGEGLRELVDYVAARHFSKELEGRSDEYRGNASLVLLDAVCERFAQLVSHWQVLGFVHGVLNTDNALLCGETIDYGPCAFMDNFDPEACFSSIDRQGRYAWPNQPGIIHWNLAVLAECLLPLIDEDPEIAQPLAQSVIDLYPQRFHHYHQLRLAAKLGLDHISESDGALIQTFHTLLASHNLDFTLAFRWLAEIANDTLDHSPLPALFVPPAALLDWAEQWKSRRNANKGDTLSITETMSQVNPTIIPRNHLVHRAIDLAESGETAWVKQMVSRSADPFVWRDDDLDWARAPATDERIARTFCGT